VSMTQSITCELLVSLTNVMYVLFL